MTFVNVCQIFLWNCLWIQNMGQVCIMYVQTKTPQRNKLFALSSQVNHLNSLVKRILIGSASLLYCISLHP
jgi:hypothetical protein